MSACSRAYLPALSTCPGGNSVSGQEQHPLHPAHQQLQQQQYHHHHPPLPHSSSLSSIPESSRVASFTNWVPGTGSPDTVGGNGHHAPSPAPSSGLYARPLAMSDSFDGPQGQAGASLVVTVQVSVVIASLRSS